MRANSDLMEVKNMKKTAFIFFLIFLTNSAHPSSSGLKETIEKHFASLVDVSQPKEKQYKSILVAVVTPFETKIIPIGILDDQGTVANELTVFEIGSITKGLVGLLLAQKTLEEVIHLDAKYNSHSYVMLPTHHGTNITWRQLAQHVSGLPKVPSNLVPTNPYQPYLEYDELKLGEFFNSYKLDRKPGLHFEYSNLGASLVSYGLEKKHSQHLDQLLQNSYLNDLQIKNTKVLLDSDLKNRLAPVYHNGVKIEAWDWNNKSVLSGGGGLKSTIHDMKTLMSAMMGLIAYDFSPIANLATLPTLEYADNSQMGLFWYKLKAENIIWHNGGTYGSSSFFGYDPDSLVGVVALSNSNVFLEKVVNGQSTTVVDDRITKSSIRTVLDTVQNLQIDNALKIVKTLKNEVDKRNTAFNLISEDYDNEDWVKNKITHMHDVDQYVRNQYSRISEYNFSEKELKFFLIKFNHIVSIIDMKNTKDLKKLLKKHEWFNISRWGEKVDKMAWLLVQHSDKDPKFQKDTLITLNKLRKAGETNPSNYAYLYDRVATGEGKPQKYGTQLICGDNGSWEFLPIENIEQVNQRRSEVDLSTIEDYKKQFSGSCK